MPDGFTLKEIVQKLDEKIVGLSGEIKELKDTLAEIKVTLAGITALKEEIETVKKRTESNSRVITYVTGAWAVVAGIIALVGRDIINKILHLN